MKLKHFLSFLAIVLIVVGNSPVFASAKKQKSYARLLEAYTQTTVPGIPGARPRTNTYFIIVWQGAKNPETFFWYNDSKWLTCTPAKAHKVASKGVNNYVADDGVRLPINKGDTVMLTLMPNGGVPGPQEISKAANNTLYYKSGTSGWLLLPVRNIGKKPDITRQ